MEKLSQQKRTKESCELSISDQTTDLNAEVIRLKRELTTARMECAILKRTVAYFAKGKLPGGGSS
jgi:transposase-like protein